MRAALANLRAVGVDGRPLRRESPAADRVARSMCRVLEDSSLCAWATVTPDNRAHVNTAYFAWSDRLDLYVLSHPASVHSRNIAANASSAVAVAAPSQRWGGPDRGVQLFGTCAAVSGADLGEAEQIYGQRFAAYVAWKPGVKRSEPAAEYRLFRIRPHSVKILDEADFGDAVWIEADVVS